MHAFRACTGSPSGPSHEKTAPLKAKGAAPREMRQYLAAAGRRIGAQVAVAIFLCAKESEMPA